jgi:hypothetical protein
VRDKDIETRGDLGPTPLGLRAAAVHECPIQEFLCIRRAPKRNTTDRHSCVLDVGGVAQQFSRKQPGQLEKPVMISTRDQPVFDRLFSQPAIEGEYFFRMQAGIHEVAGMNEDISIGEILNQIVTAVGIGGYYQAH